MEAWQLHAHVGGDPQRNRPGVRKVLLEPGKQLIERPQASGKENVKMPRLRCSGPVTCVCGQRITFQDDDLLEMVGECACRGQTAYPSTDHDRASADKF
jgi:hypothetical protein